MDMNLQYLQILLSVECNCLGLDFAIFDVNLVSTKNDRDVLTHPNKIPVPVGYILVCHSRSDVKHDNGTLTLNVVAITKATKLLLTSCVPYIKADRSSVCIEYKWMYFNSQCCYMENKVYVIKLTAVLQSACFNFEFFKFCL